MRKVAAHSFYNQGFTLVELLIVISLVGILASVTLSILNPKKQRQVAEDGVRQSNLEKLALGIEAYAANNSKYPTEAEMVPDPNAGNKPTGIEAALFISKIPNNEPTQGTTYTYSVSSDLSSFNVWVSKASNIADCFKYESAWGNIRDCMPCGTGICSGPTPTPIPTPTSAPTPTPTPMLVMDQHSFADCTNAGGTLFNVTGSDYLCKFTGPDVSCPTVPTVWIQYNNWQKYNSTGYGGDTCGFHKTSAPTSWSNVISAAYSPSTHITDTILGGCGCVNPNWWSRGYDCVLPISESNNFEADRVEVGCY